MNKRRIWRLLVFTGTLGGLLAPSLIGVVPAAALGVLGPDPADDTSRNGFRYVVSNTSYVQVEKTFVKVLFNGPRQTRTITIQDANLCNNGSDYGSVPAGAEHTQFRLFKLNGKGDQAGGMIDSVWGRGGACANKTLTIPAGAWSDGDELSDFRGTTYGVMIVAAIKQQGTSNTQNSFRYRAPNGIVGPTATDGRDTGYQQVGSDGGINNYSTLNFKMRTPCELDKYWHPIDIYDPDNGVAGIQPEEFWVKVFNMDTKKYLPAGDYNPGPRWTGNAQNGFKPGRESNQHYYLGVKWQPDTRYEVRLFHVGGNNTLQVGIPFDSPTYALQCNTNQPTGNVVEATCPSGEENAQRIRFRVDDEDGPTVGRVKIGSWQSTNYASGDIRTFTRQGDAIGLDFGDRTYRVVLEARDKRADGTSSGFIKVAESDTQLCGANGSTVYPKVQFNQSEVEVGGDATGRTSYFSSFQMPTDRQRQYGIPTIRYRGPYIAYQSQMWLDNGDNAYGAGDQEIMNDNVPQSSYRDMPSPVSDRTLKSDWRKDDVPLLPLNDPRYKICLSIKIDRAWYEYATQSVTPRSLPYDHDDDPDTPDITDPPYGNGYGGWIGRDIPGTDTGLKPRCITIEKWASMEVQEGDIETGGVFPAQGASACNPSEDIRSLGVIGHDHAVAPTQRGSKAEYGILAAGSIIDFGSNNRLARQTNSAVLDFANVGGLGNFYGTGSGLTTNCFADVFGAYPGDAASPLNADGASVSATASGQSHYAFSSSNRTLTINGGTLSPGTSRIIRVTDEGGGGNTVVINGNIRFSPGPYGRAADVPQFVLLVDGDIDVKVASSVREVSGLYVTRGSFFTCEEADLDAWNINLDSTSKCRDPLVVNGAIIAGGQLLPYRTNADDATYAEPAELFRLRGDILISDYAQKLRRGNLDSISEIELPARF